MQRLGQAALHAGRVGARLPRPLPFPVPVRQSASRRRLPIHRVVERTARRLLHPGGLVAVEHGAQQGAAVYWVFPEESGWRDTRNNKDLAGRDRFVTAAWSGEGA